MTLIYEALMSFATIHCWVLVWNTREWFYHIYID